MDRRWRASTVMFGLLTGCQLVVNIDRSLIPTDGAAGDGGDDASDAAPPVDAPIDSPPQTDARDGAPEAPDAGPEAAPDADDAD